MILRTSLFALAMFLLALFLAWAGGLVVFVGQIKTYVEKPITADASPVDAIVVLTGGSERVDKGLALLKAGKGKKLFISGVFPGVGLDHVLLQSEVSPELKQCCIILGHSANNTLGNAEETKAFVRDEEVKTIRLVTSHYHMPRSLLLLQASMPEVEIIPEPVQPENVNLSAWWHSPGTASLLIAEYTKYLFSVLRLFVGAA